MKWRRVMVSLFLISFYGSSLWKEEDALFIKACFPNEIEESAGQSILHSLSGHCTLKSRRLAFHKRLIAKWNGSQSRQVYSSFSFYGSSLWKEEDALSIKACFPNEIEESARQSILHFSILSITLKRRRLAFHKGLISKWNGGERWQV